MPLCLPFAFPHLCRNNGKGRDSPAPTIIKPLAQLNFDAPDLTAADRFSQRTGNDRTVGHSPGPALF
ncbi:hypothetical protein J1TS5_18240 [Paenibacillus macerans]|nr:hypothetical protein J1TS5_18240 [Paenibacillus macerans]